MLKISLLYRRHAQIEQQAFRQAMLEYAAQIAQGREIVRFCLNMVQDVRVKNVDMDQASCDATAELWLPSGEGLEAFCAEHRERTSAICGSVAVLPTEEHVILEGPTMPAAYKMVVLLQARPDMSASSWRSWWFEHAQLTRQVPGLRGFRINLLDQARCSGMQGTQFDGTAQLWFDSRARMEAGFATAIGRQALLDSDDHCDRRIRFSTEEHVIKS